MTLGRIGAFGFEPQLRDTFFRPRRISPQQPQNLLRAVTLSGVHRTARLLHGLGALGADALDAGQAQGYAVANNATHQSDPVAMNLPSLPKWPWQQDSSVISFTGLLAAASLSVVSAGIAGYHGYRRDKSAMAGVGWGFMGALFPVVTPIVAFAQGYARPRGRR